MAEQWYRLAEATCHAFKIHARQLRKGVNTPYIAHLMAVSSLVLEYGGDEEQAIAGLLHDAIEDVGAAEEKVIADRFGPRVAHIVRGCTDADTTPKPPWRARKEAYLAHLATADQDTLLVSCADKLHNARAITADRRHVGDSVFSRFSAGRGETLWYYSQLSQAFNARLKNRIAGDLADVVHAMHEAFVSGHAVEQIMAEER